MKENGQGHADEVRRRPRPRLGIPAREEPVVFIPGEQIEPPTPCRAGPGSVDRRGRGAEPEQDEDKARVGGGEECGGRDEEEELEIDCCWVEEWNGFVRVFDGWMACE